MLIKCSLKDCNYCSNSSIGLIWRNSRHRRNYIPPFICWSPDLQCDDIWRWGLWEVIRFRWDTRAVPSWRDWCSSKKRHQSESPFPLIFPLFFLCLSFSLWLCPCHVKAQSEGCYPQARKRTLIRNWPCWHLDLRFVASKTQKVNVCCLSLPSLWYSIMAVWADEYSPLSPPSSYSFCFRSKR